jgi:DnaJ-class molecular chaperone
MAVEAKDLKKDCSCFKCDGTGHVTATSPTSQINYELKCDVCEGTGKLLEDWTPEFRMAQLEKQLSKINSRRKELEKTIHNNDEIREIMLKEALY